jgi:hypothetical protein
MGYNEAFSVSTKEEILKGFERMNQQEVNRIKIFRDLL